MVRLSEITEVPAHLADAENTTAGVMSNLTAAMEPVLEQARQKAKEKFHLQLAEYADEFTTSVYASRFASKDLPKHQMPESPMPKEIAYRMIKDDLSLDNNPKLKYVRR